MKPVIHLTLLCLFFSWLASPPHVQAQQGRREDDPPIKVTLYPAAAPVPALKYALLPRFIDQLEGNAAVYYGKVTAEQNAFFNSKELWANIDKWRNESTLEQLRQVDFSEGDSSIVHQLDMASRCEYCDWQIPVRREKFYTILLPEVQQTRQFGRILSTKARIHIAKGEYEEALADIRRGYALSRHVAEGETLINGLVGIAIGSTVSEQVHTMIQQPDAPNLYWALTELPDPMISLRRGVMVEMYALEMSFPELKNLEQADYSPEHWRELFNRFANELHGLAFTGNQSSHVEVLVAALRGYPMAKKALIQQGMSAKEVEEMPVAKVIMIYTMRTYRQHSDELYKWYFVPYHQLGAGKHRAIDPITLPELEPPEIIPVASILLPAIRSVRTAEARMSQRIALLRVLEALRMHAHQHDGKLPDSLEQITLVPVPHDPITDQPFAYRLEGEVAHLEATPMPGWHAEYEIRLGKK